MVVGPMRGCERALVPLRALAIWALWRLHVSIPGVCVNELQRRWFEKYGFEYKWFASHLVASTAIAGRRPARTRQISSSSRAERISSSSRAERRHATSGNREHRLRSTRRKRPRRPLNKPTSKRLGTGCAKRAILSPPASPFLPNHPPAGDVKILLREVRRPRPQELQRPRPQELQRPRPQELRRPRPPELQLPRPPELQRPRPQERRQSLARGRPHRLLRVRHGRAPMAAEVRHLVERHPPQLVHQRHHHRRCLRPLPSASRRRSCACTSGCSAAT